MCSPLLIYSSNDSSSFSISLSWTNLDDDQSRIGSHGPHEAAFSRDPTESPQVPVFPQDPEGIILEAFRTTGKLVFGPRSISVDEGEASPLSCFANVAAGKYKGPIPCRSSCQFGHDECSRQRHRISLTPVGTLHCPPGRSCRWRATCKWGVTMCRHQGVACSSFGGQ